MHAPPILANAPAPDISKFTLYTVEGHVWQDDKGVRTRLQGSLSAALRDRAAEHVPLIREMARRQLATFVEKWMADSFSDGKDFHVKVLFADEKEGALPPAEKPPAEKGGVRGCEQEARAADGLRCRCSSVTRANSQRICSFLASCTGQKSTATRPTPTYFTASKARKKGNGVANGTRTRNSQNHNLELYH